jgi:hypothetical protein
MSANAIVPGALILAVFGVAAHAAAQPPQPPGPEALPPPAVAPGTSPMPDVLPAPATAAQPPAGALPPGSVPDPWINYIRPGCCGPIGADGPIGWEFYWRNGVSMPVATGLKEFLHTGWMTSVGERTLFFNQATDAAWTIDLGLSYSYQDSGRNDKVFDLLIPFRVTNNANFPPTTTTQTGMVPVTVRDYQRASFNVALGREWYLMVPAYTPGRHWRIGFDSGGRWGTSRLEFNDLANPSLGTGFRHRTDVIGAYFIALHTDLEIPVNACTWFVLGLRAEWNYNWSDILHNTVPGLRSDLQDVNLLITTGFRF